MESRLILPAGLDSKCPSIKPQAVLSSKGTLVMNPRQFDSFLKISVESPHQQYSYRLAFFNTRLSTIYVRKTYFAKQE